jgi:hypothetical protein
MKLNFWQWLGLILLLLGVAFWLYERRAPSSSKPGSNTSTAPVVQPTR